MPTPSAAALPPPLVLMHGGHVEFTFQSAEGGTVQARGPVTAHRVATGTGRVLSIRVSDARVVDSRLRRVLMQIDELADLERHEDYQAGLRKALEMIEALYPINRTPAPEPPAGQDRFADPRGLQPDA